jgi:DNA primase
LPRLDLSYIDVPDYLECLDIRNVERATEKEVKFSCPLPAHASGDESPSAYMNIHTTAFFCHSCHARGNAVTFAAQVLGVSPVQVTRMLKQRYSAAGIHPDARNMEEEIRKLIAARQNPIKRENIRLDESVLDQFYVDWHYLAFKSDDVPDWLMYLAGRGFTAAELVRWEFGYHPERDRITLPIRDEEGYLVGIKARAYRDEQKPKYLNLKDPQNGIEAFLKNEIVFGLDRVISSDDDFDTLILVEGEYNAIAMQEWHGYPNTVAINGSYFGERQIKLIKRHCDKAILFFDSDRAGFDATAAVGEALRPFINVSVCPEHPGDPMNMHPYSVRRCITGAVSLRELQFA